jgi:maltose alpha-D-glucosyltransferase/alpha-amylase
LSEHDGQEPVEMLGYVPFPTISKAPYALTLAPYSFLWLELQPARDAEPLTETQPASHEADIVSELAAIEIATQGWAGFLAGHGPALLETALPAWLPRQRWFGAKARRIQTVRVLDWVELADGPGLGAHPDRPTSPELAPPALCFIEVSYLDGPSDTYQIPLAFSSGDAVNELLTANPQSIISALNGGSGAVLLHDATAREDFRQALLALIEGDATVSLSAQPAKSPEPYGLETLASGFAAANELTQNSTAHSPPARLEPYVDPLPISAQPGEAVAQSGESVAAPPMEWAAPSAHASKRFQPGTSPHGNLAEGYGRLEARASTLFAPIKGVQHPSARVGSAEQSNTSILYGKQLILKLFRRLQPGENPDVEIGRFLTETAHFKRIAPFFGEIGAIAPSGEKTTIAMLQGLVANHGDGWQWFADGLAEFFGSVADQPAPPQAAAASFLNDQPMLKEAAEYANSAMQGAALLGRRTAEMHLALATPTDDPAFAAEPFTQEDLTRDAQRIDAQITSTLEALKIKLSTLKEGTADSSALLLSRRIDLFARANAITSATAGGLRIRIHGDYHLGQTLRIDANQNEADGASADIGDFVLLDFEGEPARPLAERRRKQSPLKDVAGMIRSLSYAAYSGLNEYLAANQELAYSPACETVTAWAVFWQNSTSAEFLRSYRTTIAARPALLPTSHQSQALLGAYLLEKALYELLYELNNRPAWLRIPLAGILAL